MKKILSYFAIIALSLGFITSCDLDIYPSNILTEEQMKEAMILGLRLLEGVSFRDFKARFGITPEDAYKEILEKHLQSGLLTLAETSEDRFIRLSVKGLDLANVVMSEF